MNKCMFCGANIDYGNIYCSKRVCRSKFEHRIAKAHNSKACRDYTYWYKFSITHITFEKVDIPE